MTLRRRLIPLTAAALGTALLGLSVNGMAGVDHNLRLAASKGPAHTRPADTGAPAYDCPRLKRSDYSRSL